MNFRNAVVLIWIGVFAVACAQSVQISAGPDVDLAAEEAAVRALSARWLELETAKDSAGIAALFAGDGVLMRENQEPVVGTDAIEAFVRAEQAASSTTVVNWDTDRVEVSSSGDLAAEYGSWTVTGDGELLDEGRYVAVYRKVGGEWKVSTDTSISTVPGVE